MGVEIALVVGAGNIWRGLAGSKGGMDRVTADHMGMLATTMNALCLKDAFRQTGVKCHVHCAVSMMPFAKQFDREQALEQLSRGELVIFAGGTGSPYFTTDTTAALRALETNCQAVMKATKVNGIYTADPMKDKSAVKFGVKFYRNKTFIALATLLIGYNLPIAAPLKETVDSSVQIVNEWQKLKKMSQESSWGQSTLENSQYQDYVMILGESARKDYLHAYGYPVNDTPFM